MKIFFPVIIVFVSICDSVASKFEKCFTIKSDVFSNCTTKRRYTVMKRPRKISFETKHTCPNKICQDEFKITSIRKQLYNSKVFNQFIDMLELCCGNCVSYTVVNEITRLTQINKTVLETSDIIFPIFEWRYATRRFGYYFIPVHDAPSGFYFTLRVTTKERVVSFISGLLSTWPLLVICLVLSLFSGFIIWLLEKHKNPSEFPSSFCSGLWEGAWWAIISMTTVGYGDKTPISLPGRLYSVFWILLGITMFSILTSALTAQFSNILSHPTPNLVNKKVGGLKGKMNTATLIAQHGGFIIEYDFTSLTIGYRDLVMDLNNRKLDGFVLSRPFFNLVSLLLKRVSEKDIVDQIKHVDMEQTEIDYIGKKLSIGMLVKDETHYEYFKGYFDDNWLLTYDCNEFDLNYKSMMNSFGNGGDHGILTGRTFYSFLYCMSGIMVAICCFGLLYELKRHHREKSALLFDPEKRKNDEES